MTRWCGIVRGVLLAGVMIVGIVASASAAQNDKPKSEGGTARAVRLPPLPTAIVDNSLAIGGDDIAARKVRTRMTVAAQVDGKGPFRFVVDSGADSSALSQRTARSLRLPPGSPVVLHGMTASSLVDRVVVTQLALGQSIVRDLELPVLRDEDLGADGLIGIDALVEQRLMMDFDKRLITIEDAQRPAQRLDGEIVVTARRRRGQLILTQASVAGLSVDAVIDTGSEVTIGNSALRDRLARGKQLQEIEVTGVTGVTLKMPILRVAEIRVGPVIMRSVPIAFYDVPPFAVFGLDERPAMLLGTDLMESFRRISLDFRHRKVRFQLKRCNATSITIRTTGSASRLSSNNRIDDVCGGTGR